ncbi:MAG: hypothetical protein ABIK92_01325 [Pseudomonadota bacterium]
MDNLRPSTHKRSEVDRRRTLERRQSYDVLVVDILGQERRRPTFERRKNGELRKDWTRINKWISVPVSVFST